MITDIYTETESDYDDTDHAVSPTSSSSSWRGRNENGTITARAKTSTDKHEGEKESTKSDTEAYPLSSWVFKNYVEPILLEDSIELLKDLLGKFADWYEEESIYYNELMEECCEREELDKVESLNGQITALNSSFREQLHLIRMHCQQLDDRTDEQSDEESPETSNNTFLPQSNVASDYEADSHSTTGSTDNDGGVEPPELNDDPSLSRYDTESSDENEDDVEADSLNSQTEDDDNQEDDDMTYMLSLISDIERRIEELRNSLDVDETDSDSSNDLTESEPEEPPETEDNTSLSRLDVDTQNDLTGSEAEGKWFQAVGNSSPTDPESHDIETAGTSYKNGQDSNHLIETTESFSESQNAQSAKIIEIGTDLTESYRDINNLKTFESNKTVLDLSGDLSTGIMFGLGHHIEDLFKCEPNQQNSLVDSHEKTEKEWSVIEDITSLSDAEPQDEEAVQEINGNDQNGKHPMDRSGESPETCTKPFPQQSNTVSYDGAMIVNATELETVTEHRSVVNKGRSSETILRSKPQEIKRVKPKVKYRNHRQYETDQILTNKSENNAIWMLEVFKRYFRQHLFKSSKPPSIM